MEKDTISGCTNYNSAKVSVVDVHNGGNKTFCSGTGVTIGAARIIGHTYFWRSDDFSFLSNIANPTVSPTTNTVYTLTETDSVTSCYNYNNDT